MHKTFLILLFAAPFLLAACSTPSAPPTAPTRNDAMMEDAETVQKENDESREKGDEAMKKDEDSKMQKEVTGEAMKNETNDSMTEEKASEAGEKEIMEKSPPASESPSTSAAEGAYTEFSTAKYNALKGSEPFILYFHADWCPTCRALTAKLRDDLTVLKGHTILEADYDTETELKKTYDITIQTSLVFFDADGNVVKTRVNPPVSEIEAFFQ